MVLFFTRLEGELLAQKVRDKLGSWTYRNLFVELSGVTAKVALGVFDERFQALLFYLTSKLLAQKTGVALVGRLVLVLAEVVEVGPRVVFAEDIPQVISFESQLFRTQYPFQELLVLGLESLFIKGLQDILIDSLGSADLTTFTPSEEAGQGHQSGDHLRVFRLDIS